MSTIPNMPLSPMLCATVIAGTIQSQRAGLNSRPLCTAANGYTAIYTIIGDFDFVKYFNEIK
jgi:hypothetical protein